MGRGRNRKGGNSTKRGRDEWHADNRTPSTLSNAAFDRYYRGHVVPEEDWEPFITALRTVLPTALRININCQHADGVRRLVAEHLNKVVPTTDLSFYPRGLGMQSVASRSELKRNVEFKVQKRLITALSEGGFLTRQEAVSMIPPLVLDVQPGDVVLDLCAAPGSKTSQMLENIVAGGGGCVVANDVNSSRLDVLNHQTNRIPRAQSHLIITNNDALTFPLCACAADKFDRVLCDVMCSGDGTLRKSVDLWSRWNALQGADLHSSQLRALTRGMMLCKKGGSVVYSTCSLNPLEDEAVVQHCLRASNGTFRLVRAADRVPGLKFSPGRTAWTITSKDLQEEYATFAEAEAANERRGGKGFHYRPTMFADSAFLAEANIHYTMRVLPHQQDTGGFFIAAFECLDDYPNSLASERKPSATAPVAAHAVPAPAPVSAALGAVVKEALALPEAFPLSRLLVRGETLREQKIYLVSPAAAARLQLLVAAGCRVDQAGAKVFESYVRHTNNKLRFSADGCSALAELLPAPFKLRLGPQQLLDVASGSTSNLMKMLDERPTRPRPCFIVECDLGEPLGTLVCPAIELGTVAVKLLEWQKTLLHFALGNPIVEENPTVLVAGGEVSGGSSAAGSDAEGEEK
jgi:tRNA (cytosine34-C5)-methyltransferase